MTKIFIPILTAALFLLTSCSFNKAFLKPDKVPPTAKILTLKSGADTTVIYFSPDKHQPTFIKNSRDTIDLGFTIESVVFKSANGNNLNGWLLKPKNKSANITLLHFHGNAGFLINQYPLISPLIKNGFQIFIFDYSGFGFSEGKATRENVLTDGLSALDYLKGRQDVKDTKLVIYGQSFGGHVSAVVATQRQSYIDGLVIEGAFSSHKDIGAKLVPIIGRIFVKQGYCATESIKNFHKPLLVIHSSEDEIIPFKMGKKIFDNANQQKEFYEIKKSHIYGAVYYTDEISQKIKSMLTKN